ncbi:unnamed protein product [Phaedon cochleariae]|uniref:Rieske domain-containing protein n=1 Tax=Phaedon cochleariae TaxID=80249 RepID=A0A9P0DF62_PHACE|nr:unnamed protein product [Phaedon cochleariae]
MIGKSMWQGLQSLESLLITSKQSLLVRYLNNWPKKRFLALKMGCSTSKLDLIQKQGLSTAPAAPEDYVEDVVCKVDDIKDNELKTFDLDEGKVLLVKQNGKISALGTKCTHYGAPLVSSALGDGRVRCQWHGACFNIATGDIEDFPGQDSLPCYKVTIDSDNVRVRALRSELKANKRVKVMAKRDAGATDHVVVVGGGPSGGTCVEVLRQEGFKGKITLVCRENYLPYDRVKVSKAMDFDIKKGQFREEAFYQQYDIEVLRGVEATSVDTEVKTVTLSTGNTLHYDKLFVATGCRPRKLEIPGADLKDVIVLRDYAHAEYTLSVLSEDKELVVVGGSFIAMEAANFCKGKVKKVTVVLRGELPFQPLLGPEIGKAFLDLFEQKGVHFVKNNSLSRVTDDGNGKVVGVELCDGTTLKADLVIMGVGSTYNTDFLKNSGVSMRPDGTVETDERLRTNVPEVYVGGDIAYAPVWSHGGKKSAIGHFPLAHYHGKVAAMNILGKETQLRTVPFFWTMLFGKSVRYCGHGKYDEIILHGSVENFKFVAFYLENGEVVATSSCGMDPIVSQFGERLARGEKLLKDHLQGDALAWAKQ